VCRLNLWRMELFKYMKVCHGVRRLPPPRCRHQAPLGTPRHQSDKSRLHHRPDKDCGGADVCGAKTVAINLLDGGPRIGERSSP
jgi:hypothetical protein